MKTAKTPDKHTIIRENTMETVAQALAALVAYAEKTGMIASDDRAYTLNRLLDVMQLDGVEPTDPPSPLPALPEILSCLTESAVSRGLLPEDTVTYRDLFDTALMGELMPRPSEVKCRFAELYERSPREATDYFYRLACDSNYIRVDRVSRDRKWRTPSEYGEIDITINLSKPEKDPRAIAAAKLLPQSGYPKCLLCHENEGYSGNAGKPARQNLRQIPFDMAGTPWYLQYSPYVYYNEHCIALSSRHEPMRIDRSSFSKLLDFVTCFPHYFIGSNADLPIVGGSILSHDHMQGGRYTFAMESAPIETPLVFAGFEEITAGIVKWPMSVIRLTGGEKERLVELSDRILTAWRAYSDPSAEILAETDGEPHNTITPIARRRGELFELDLVLRNNRTSEEHPLGIFHPHAELHHIKRENIGLIEVMGLAVLPARLRDELDAIAELLLEGGEIASDSPLASHADWVAEMRRRYPTFTPETVMPILEREVGEIFVRVPLDAGVYRRDDAGKEAFLRFVASVG